MWAISLSIDHSPPSPWPIRWAMPARSNIIPWCPSRSGSSQSMAKKWRPSAFIKPPPKTIRQRLRFGFRKDAISQFVRWLVCPTSMAPRFRWILKRCQPCDMNAQLRFHQSRWVNRHFSGCLVFFWSSLLLWCWHFRASVSHAKISIHRVWVVLFKHHSRHCKTKIQQIHWVMMG